MTPPLAKTVAEPSVSFWMASVCQNTLMPKGHPAATRGVAYLRLSKAGDGYGLPAQERAIRQRCKDDGVTLVSVERDNGYSGKLAKRPGLLSALNAIADGQAQTLYVARIDRLS